MPRCCHLEDACHRILSLVAAALTVVGVAVIGATMYRPADEQLIAVYWSLFGAVCLQAVALQFHRCFSSERAWTGAVTATYLAAVVAVPTHLWLRHRYECEAADFEHLAPQEVLVRSREVHRAAQFTSIVACLAVLLCMARWISVAMVREARRDRRDAALVDDRRRRTAGDATVDIGNMYDGTLMQRRGKSGASRRRVPAVFDTMGREEELVANTSDSATDVD